MPHRGLPPPPGNKPTNLSARSSASAAAAARGPPPPAAPSQLASPIDLHGDESSLPPSDPPLPSDDGDTEMAGSPKAGEKRTADALSPVAPRRNPKAPVPKHQTMLLAFAGEVRKILTRHDTAMSNVEEHSAIHLKESAWLVGRLAAETSWMLDALSVEKESDQSAQQAFAEASRVHGDILSNVTLTIPTPFDNDNSSNSSNSPDPATSTEVSALAKMVQQLSTQVATISRQVLHIAERPIPRPKQPATTTQPAPPRTSTFTYAQAAAAPAPPASNPQPTGANPQPTAPASGPKQPKKQRQPPPPPKC